MQKGLIILGHKIFIPATVAWRLLRLLRLVEAAIAAAVWSCMLEQHHLWSFVIDWKENQFDMRNDYESTTAWNQIIELKILLKYGN